MYRKHVQSLVVACLGVTFFAQAAEASHWRFGHVTWQRVSGRTVDVTVTEGYRSGFIGCNSYTWDDGSGSFSNCGASTIATGTDFAGESFTIIRSTHRHTYPSDGPFTVSFDSCCRIGSIVNPSTGQRMEAVIDLSGGNQGSPVSSIPVIIQMVQGGLNIIPIAIADPDGDPFGCRMATPGESFISSVAAQSFAASVSDSCVLSWDTTGTSIGQKYAVQVAILENGIPVQTPPPPIPGNTPTALRFSVGHANCGSVSFSFAVNGTPIETSGPTNGCVCNATPLVLSFTSPSVLGLLTNGVGQDVLTMTMTGNSGNVGYVRGEIDRAISGTETLCLKLGGSSACFDQDVCNLQLANGGNTFTAPSAPVAQGPRVALDFIIEIIGGAIPNQTPPTCTLNGNINNVVQVGQAFSISMTGDDADGGNLTLNDFGLPSGSTLSPASGTTSAVPFTTTFSWTPTAADSGSAQSVTVSFTDPVGLQATCSFAIQVPSNQPPVPVCQDVTVSADASCQGNVAAAAVDAGSFDPDGDPLTLTLMPTGPFSLGSTSVMLDVDDGTESRCCSATINVVDTTDPTVACPADATLECPANTSVAANGSATASDNCDPAPSIGSFDSSVPGCGNTETLTRTWTADDAASNSSSCDQTITVEDTTQPVFTSVPASVTVTDVDCSGDEAVALGAAAATDDCGIVTITDDRPATFLAGQTTTVTFTATDECGNSSTASTTVAVLFGADIWVFAAKHTVGSGSNPGSTKEPFDPAIEVCAYDKADGSCARDTCGGISHQFYECIATTCAATNCCTTDTTTGDCNLNLPPGDYVVISNDVTKTTLPDPLGVSASDLVCGEHKQKHLQQIIKSNGAKRPGKTTRLTGSELLIIELEFVVWDETEQAYPFVFETVGDWAVTTSVAPPEGFEADYDSLAADVDNEIEAVQFIITEVGSDLVPTQTTFEVDHNGVHHTVHSHVGIKLTEAYAISRGFDVVVLRLQGLIYDPPPGVDGIQFGNESQPPKLKTNE